MAIHGVDEDERVTLSNMKFLYEQMKQADRVVSY